MTKSGHTAQTAYRNAVKTAGLLLLLFLLCGLQEASAQCSSITPVYTVDMTGTSDSVWTSPSVSRDGYCCSANGSDRCILFKVTIDSMAAGIKLNITGGTGSTFYEEGCSNSTAVGSLMCLTGTGPFNITVCKPGGNPQQYTITSIPKPHIPMAKVYITPTCTAKLVAIGYDTSSITWTAVQSSSYNANLSCTSGCDTVTVSASASFPAYVDFKVCGTSSSSCLTGTFCDTVRVYFADPLKVDIYPSVASLCGGASSVRIAARPWGGHAPYTYSWNNGSTDSAITVGAGTYIVTVNDSLGCIPAQDTVVITSQPNPTPSISGSVNACEQNKYTYTTPSASGRSYSWSATGGTIVSGTGTNSVSILWNTVGSRQVSVTETINSTGCQATATYSVSVLARPTPTTIQH